MGLPALSIADREAALTDRETSPQRRRGFPHNHPRGTPLKGTSPKGVLCSGPKMRGSFERMY